MTMPRCTLPRTLWLATVLALCASAAAAQNLLVNGDFDANLNHWSFAPPAHPSVSKSWSPLDAGGSPNSGSLRATYGEPLGAHAAVQCADGVIGGEHYTLSADVLIPDGQSRPGTGLMRVFWADLPGCISTGAQQGLGFNTVGAWTHGTTGLTAPVGAESVWVELGGGASEGSGTFSVHFDNVVFCRTAQCEGDGDDGWLTTSELPGFRFRVTVTSGGDSFFGERVIDCVPGALCVSGALAGRTEILLRVIGPRPNGFLWLQAVRFTPAQLDVEVHQLGTGVQKSYHLDAIGPEEDRLDGLFDRTAFLP